jgi:hypothetical protein
VRKHGSTVIKTSLSDEDTNGLQKALQPPTPAGTGS